MKKPFLLIAGYDHYPWSGTGDWKACYESYAEAREQVEVISKKGYSLYGIDGIDNYDWYEIVDLREWTEE